MQNSTENVAKSPKFCTLTGNRGRRIEWQCQNLHRKFINNRFCACAVQMLLKMAVNAAIRSTFEVQYGNCYLRVTWFGVCAVAAYAFSLVINGNVITHNSRTDRRRVFKLGSKVGHVTRHAQQQFKVKRSKVKVTKLRDVSADKNPITRQCIVISSSNFVEIIDVGIDACGILSRSVGQTNRK